MGHLEDDGIHSGVPDDRWAFTTHSTPLDYNAISSLAAASRVLRGFDDSLANECLQTAERIWKEEHSHPPALFHSFNTTGGELNDEETKAAVELLIASKGSEIYRHRLQELVPVIQQRFAVLGWTASRAIPFMPPEFKETLASALRTNKARLDENLAKNPYGVLIPTGTWGGGGCCDGIGSADVFLA
jgi:endoglucanase